MLFVVFYLVCYAPCSQANPLDEVIIILENSQMKWLEKEKSAAPNIKPFVSDGCSGGMSDSWQFLASQIPEFASKYGNVPLWEQCCIDHDRVYWQGETNNGYALRKQADIALKRCVLETGQPISARLKGRGDEQQKVDLTFEVVAEMMYQAVRLGGKPCSFLPWRWGYGWPHCSFHLIDDNE